MTSALDFLVEIGTEELPAKGLASLGNHFADNLRKQFQEAQLAYETVESFATPRRLAVIVKQLAVQPQKKWIERKGPVVSEAFDASGQPTPAALGFAKSCGMPLDQLDKQWVGQVEHLFFKKEQTAQQTSELLPHIVKNALDKLPIPRSMRWGNEPYFFLRPVRWLVMLFGEEVVPARLFGLSAGRYTYGHRFHHPGAIYLTHAWDYVKKLETQGAVIPSFERRKELIKEKIQIISEGKGKALIEEDLLMEVTGIVEWPSVFMGSFSEEFLTIPHEVLMVAMKNHQRYFPMIDPNGSLLPSFVVVSNLTGDENQQQMIAGNERVLRARLSDAKFFYYQDSKEDFLERLPRLTQMIFQKQLGHLLEKTERMEVLASLIAEKLGIDKEKAMIAATLSKIDLTTEMVNEFPELQGVMGYYYARLFGHSEEVAEAVKSHYQPRFAKDTVPSTLLGCVIALADKVDTLVGIFGIGQIPTGEKDPFALRRCALGVLRILIEKTLPLNVYELLAASLKIYGDKVKADENLLDRLLGFMMERLRAWYADQGISAQTFSAVLACRSLIPSDFHLRIQAVQHFQTLPLAKALIMMNKRVDHLLKKQTFDLGLGCKASLFETEAEQKLAAALSQKQSELEVLEKEQQYADMLAKLVELEPVMNQFFDQVLVMTEDQKVRQNRLELLYQLQKLFLITADISCL